MKLLVIKTSSLGDVIHTLPAITDAKANNATLQIDWVVEEAFMEIPPLHAAINRVIPVALRRWRKNIIQAVQSGEVKNFLQSLRAQHYDLLIDAQGLLKSAILALCAHGTRCGYDASSAREPLASCFYQRKFKVAMEQHAITRVRQLFAQALDYPIPNIAPDYGINLANFNANQFGDNYLVFVHGTSRAEKCWSEEQWIALAKIVVEAGYTIFLPWGNPNELQRAEKIAKASSNAKVFPKSNLNTIADLIAHAKGVVAVDTGIGHLAAALGTPAVSLYGPTDVNLIGTCGKNQKHLLNFNQVTAEQVWSELSEMLTT